MGSDPYDAAAEDDADADPTPAYTAWCSLTADEVRAVTALAKRGRRHPDERVADIAADWARVLSGGEDEARRTGWAWLPGHMVVWFGLLYDGGLHGWLERRWARRVLAAQ